MDDRHDWKAAMEEWLAVPGLDAAEKTIIVYLRDCGAQDTIAFYAHCDYVAEHWPNEINSAIFKARLVGACRAWPVKS